VSDRGPCLPEFWKLIFSYKTVQQKKVVISSGRNGISQLLPPPLEKCFGYLRKNSLFPPLEIILPMPVNASL